MTTLTHQFHMTKWDAITGILAYCTCGGWSMVGWDRGEMADRWFAHFKEVARIEREPRP